jgi:hypothetical protein
MRAVLQWLVDGLLDNLLPAMIASPLLISAFALLALAYTEAHRRTKARAPGDAKGRYWRQDQSH